MKEENIAEITRRFEEYVSANIPPEQLTPQIDIDAFLHLLGNNAGVRFIAQTVQSFRPRKPQTHFRTPPRERLARSKSFPGTQS